MAVTHGETAIPLPTAELDAITFATQYCALMLRSGTATESDNNAGVLFIAAELEQLQADNPLRTQELQARWEDTDKDL